MGRSVIDRIKSFFGDDTNEWRWTSFPSTAGYLVSPNLIDWIIGQEHAIEECKLCIDEWVNKLGWLNEKQWWKTFEITEKRKEAKLFGHHLFWFKNKELEFNPKPTPKEMLPAGPFLLMLGDAGTGKSLLGRAMQSYMTNLYKEKGIGLYDVCSWYNKKLPSQPQISIHPSPKGSKIVEQVYKQENKRGKFAKWGFRALIGMLLGFGSIILGYLTVNGLITWFTNHIMIVYDNSGFASLKPIQSIYPTIFNYALDVMIQNVQLVSMGIMAMAMGGMLFIFSHFMGNMMGGKQKGTGGAENTKAPKLLIDNSSGTAPFVDATGHGSSQLFGSIAWNPYQCTPKGQLIITNHGIKYLEECTKEDMVLGQDGTWKKITDTYVANHDADVVCIKGSGIPLLKVTKCHPIYVIDKLGIPEWKLATQLNGTEILLYPKLKLTKDIDWLSNDLAYLFGLWLADGYILDGKQVRICIGDYQKEQLEIVESLLSRLGLSFGREKYNNATRFNIYSANLVRRIESIFGQHKNAFTKEIPTEIMLLPYEKSIAFIKGYIDGDGGKEKERITTSSVSDKLSRGLQFMLVKNRLWANYRIQKQNGKASRFELQMTIKYASILYPNRYSFNSTRSHAKIIQRESWFEVPIRKLWTEYYKGKIYDVTSEDGCFSAPFLVHNTGGLGTPEHQRVTAGDVHRAHLGILYVDEVKNLTGAEAITLLTVLEDGQLSVALRTHSGTSGDTAAMAVATEPVPCMFFLIAAGNLDSLPMMHPALLDRIQGYGKMVYMSNDMPNTSENRRKYVQFISQEIKRFHLLPLSRDACIAVIEEASRRSGKNDKLTCKFRPMIGTIKTASILARNEGRSIVERKHVEEALNVHCKSIALQVMEKHIENEIEYKVMIDPNEKPKIGQIHGLAISTINAEGGDMIGSVLTIRASCLNKNNPKKNGYFTVTGVQATNSSYIQHSIAKIRHVIYQLYGVDVEQDCFTHVDFAQSHEVEGPSAGITITLALISILLNKKIRQDVAVTGEINIGIGKKIVITPIGGVNEKILAAQRMDFKKVCIPKRNFEKNINVSDYKIKVVGCTTLQDYMRECFI